MLCPLSYGGKLQLNYSKRFVTLCKFTRNEEIAAMCAELERTLHVASFDCRFDSLRSSQ